MLNDKKKTSKAPSGTDEEKRKIKLKTENKKPVRPEGEPSEKKESLVDLNKILDFATNIEKAIKGGKGKPGLEEIQAKLDALSDTHELDQLCWEAAAKCMKKNKEMLLKARREVNELRVENQQLKEFLKASKREGEKYKSQLENEVLRKMLQDFYE